MPEGEKKASNTSIFSPPVTYGDNRLRAIRSRLCQHLAGIHYRDCASLTLVRGGQGIVPQFNSSLNWDLGIKKPPGSLQVVFL